MTRRDERVVDNRDTDFERSDMSVRAVGWIAIGIIVLLVVAPLALVALYPSADRGVSRATMSAPPAPVLQVHGAVDMAEFRAAQNKELDSYGWIDRAHGVVHIPIDQAMHEIVQRGIQDFPKPSSP